MNLKLVYRKAEKKAADFPSMNLWLRRNLVLFSTGVPLAESCNQMAIGRAVATRHARAESQSRRLRRFISNPKWVMHKFMPEYQRWIWGALPKKMRKKRLTLMVDETKLRYGMAVMMVSVAFDGRSIPLAWRVYWTWSDRYPAEGQVGVILGLLQQLKEAWPAKQKLLVLADRGIGTSPALCRGLDALGYHYLLRVTKQTKLVTEAGEEYTIFDQVKEGETWRCQGKFFKKRGQVPGYGLAVWEEGYKEPLALVTNTADVSGREYCKRNWQEQSFRDMKSGGFNWGDSRLREPERMERMLAILAVAYAELLSLGGRALKKKRGRQLARVEKESLTGCSKDGLRRRWSVFREGLHYLIEWVLPRGLSLRLIFTEDRRLC